MKIEDREIEQNGKPFVIAEISQNHDGSLGQAHAFIDAIAETGADAIKFQTHIAEEESTLDEPFRVPFSYEDKTRYDYWKRMEFTAEQWKGLYAHAKEKGLIFLSSPFSDKAMDMLDDIGVPAWKFGAGEVFNEELLKRASCTGKPILLSSGLSTYDDIARQLSLIGSCDAAILQCVTAYPSTAEQINIKLVPKLMERYKIPVGISDHSATIYPSLAAVTMGACIVEVHVTMSRYMFGPDVKASVDLSQLKEIVDGCDFIYRMKQSDADLTSRTQKQEELKALFSKSIYYKRNLKAGEIIGKMDLVGKKPNYGIPMDRVDDFFGKKLRRDVLKDELLRESDFI